MLLFELQVLRHAVIWVRKRGLRSEVTRERISVSLVGFKNSWCDEVSFVWDDCNFQEIMNVQSKINKTSDCRIYNTYMGTNFALRTGDEQLLQRGDGVLLLI